MSGEALGDLSTLSLLDCKRKLENSSKGSFTNPPVENINDKFPTLLASTSSSSIDGMNSSINAIHEIEYIDSEKLKDLVSVETSLPTLLARLDSKDWVSVCEALNNVRQISIFHRPKLIEILDEILNLTVKALKNPRSAVCKTAMMTTADIILAYNDSIIDSFDPLLFQLLLKSSQDKRFVCEAAEKALITAITFVSSSLLLPKLQPYLKHRNPRLRAKASMCFCRSVLRLKAGPEGIKSYGIDKLIEVAASQLSDQLPESREAARRLVLELQTAYEKSQLPSIGEAENPITTCSWESFCQSKLAPLNARAILRVTSVTKDGLVTGC